MCFSAACLADDAAAPPVACGIQPHCRNIIQYPHLAPLPPDFLTAMEEYVREAPKAVDPNAHSPRRAGAGPLTSNT